MTERPVRDSMDAGEGTVGRNVLVWVIGVVLALLVGLLLLRVFIRPIAPEQDPPRFHFAKNCWVCHLVSEDAELVDVE